MSSDARRGRVLVLKERSVGDTTLDAEGGSSVAGGQDAYQIALEEAGFQTDFLPVLQHRLVNVDKITGIIASRAQEYSGVIFTSQRAVEAWSKSHGSSCSSTTSDDQQHVKRWPSIPFYAVGPATSAALSKLPLEVRPPDSLILGAEESGNAEKLADFIVKLHQQKLQNQNQDSHISALQPLLYLVGDKRRETLPAYLRDRNISLVELQAYETFPSATFKSDYQALVNQAVPDFFEWIVFFSPSGAKLLLPLLEDEGKKSNEAQQNDNQTRRRNFAAIGPTTRDFLLDYAGVTVHAMASSPSPAALVKAMLTKEEAPDSPWKTSLNRDLA